MEAFIPRDPSTKPIDPLPAGARPPTLSKYYCRSPDEQTVLALDRRTNPPLSSKSKVDWNTSHFRHLFVFCAQLSALPRHRVPLKSQQIFPAPNSHTGHMRLFSSEHPLIDQHGRFLLTKAFFSPRSINNSRSVAAGIPRQPCSKLWMPLTETPSSWAISICVLPK